MFYFILFAIFLVITFISYKLLNRNSKDKDSTLFKSAGIGFVLTIVIFVIGLYYILRDDKKEDTTITHPEILNGASFKDYNNNELNFFNKSGDTLNYTGKLNFVAADNKSFFDNLRGKIVVQQNKIVFIEGYVQGALELINIKKMYGAVTDADLIGTLTIASTNSTEPTNMKLNKN